MYIVLALIVAAAIGIAAHLVLPGRHLRGVTLSTAIAVGSAAVVYAAMTWIAGEQSVWTWVAAVAAPAAIAFAATAALSAVRRRRDAAELMRLGLEPAAR